MALELLIDAVDRITLLQAGSMVVNQTREGLNSTCAFDILDPDVWQVDAWTVEHTHVETDGHKITTYVNWGDDKPKVDVKVCDGATTYFAGVLSRMTVTQMGCEAQVVHCECHDFNQILEESVVDTLETDTNKTDEWWIDTIFTAYVTGVNFADHVVAVGTIDDASFDGITVRRVLDILASQTGAVWYVDYDKKLHYNAAGADAPAWHLSDNPDDANSFSYFEDITRARDVTNLVNKVFVIGEAASTWYENAASIAKWETHRAIIRDQTLVETDDMEARADAILDKFKDPIDIYTLSTYQDGLRAGMKIRIVCAFYDVDETFLIDQLVVTFPPDKDPVYKITCGGTTSSSAASVNRLSLDAEQDWQAYVAPSLALASRGWSHSIDFTPSDADTVTWAAGTIWTAAGPTFNIVLGTTGNMAADTVYHVYLDTAISITVLQTTTNPANAVGINRILLGACWPSGVAGVDAGYHIFGGGGDVPLVLNALNIIADSITFNEIAGNTITAAEMNIATLSAITANMGTLTAGTIQTAAAGNNRVVINIADGIRGISAANVVQFQLDPADGVAYAGAGAVILNEDGITIEADELADPVAVPDVNALKFIFDDSGTAREVGKVFGVYRNDGAIDRGQVFIIASRNAGDPWDDYCGIVLMADDNVAGNDVRFNISSGGTIDAVRCTNFQIDGDVRIEKGLVVGTKAVDPVDGYCRISKGLRVGSTAGDADDNDMWCDGEVSTDGGTVKWNLGGVNTGTITPDRKIAVEINGAWYTIAAQVGLV